MIPRDMKRIAAEIFSKLPVWPPSFVLAKTLNQALKPLLDDGSLAFLTDKRVVVNVSDLGVRFSFTLQRDGFTPARESAAPDLAISAEWYDLYLLTTRQEDPDTLFFNRRLVVEGDTELGLIAKNALDSLELPQPVLSFCNLLKKLDAYKSRQPV